MYYIVIRLLFESSDGLWLETIKEIPNFLPSLAILSKTFLDIDTLELSLFFQEYNFELPQVQ